MILTIRTDKPEAEIGLYEGREQRAYEIWTAHRQLAETIHVKIEELLASQQSNLKDVTGIVCYEGPGSFTGLRIGLTVANALAQGLQVAIFATGGEVWIQDGINAIVSGKNDHVALPEYGAPVHITEQRK